MSTSATSAAAPHQPRSSRRRQVLGAGDLVAADNAPERLDPLLVSIGDPVAAFANLRRALEPSGRRVFVCCRTPGEKRRGGRRGGPDSIRAGR